MLHHILKPCHAGGISLLSQTPHVWHMYKHWGAPVSRSATPSCSCFADPVFELTWQFLHFDPGSGSAEVFVFSNGSWFCARSFRFPAPHGLPPTTPGTSRPFRSFPPFGAGGAERTSAESGQSAGPPRPSLRPRRQESSKPSPAQGTCFCRWGRAGAELPPLLAEVNGSTRRWFRGPKMYQDL